MAKRLITVLGVFALASFVTAAPASAAIVFAFDNTGTSSGSVAYDGTGGPLTGTGITFDLFTAAGTGATDGSYVCSNCVLTFQTGNNTDETGVYEFAAGGFFTITGTVVGTGATGVLLTGTFSGPVPALAAPGAGGILTVTGTGLDTKNADLLEFFGVTVNDFIYANSEITTQNCTIQTDLGFDCRVEEADVTNTQEERETPEPGTLVLLGLSLLGFGSAARRRARK